MDSKTLPRGEPEGGGEVVESGGESLQPDFGRVVLFA